MKCKKILSLVLVAVTISSIALTGCKKGTADAKLDVPFTDLGWESTKEDVIAAEGDNYETYDSVYNGETYTFNKKFENKDGTIKYMFNDKEELKCVAWSYGTTDISDLENLYNKINDDLTNKHGDSGYNTDEAQNTVNNYGNIWYLEQGDIVLSAMTTEENKALQLAFLHPDVSYDENE